jgi:hypothetical protein
MPKIPAQCMGKKTPLKPMTNVQKCHFPSVSLRYRPVTLGNQ